jgi:hypothetical protein
MPLIIRDTTFSDNNGGDSAAGAVEAGSGGIVQISRSTFSNNNSISGGAAIDGGPFTVTNCTFVGNGSNDSAITAGGVIIRNSTFAFNGNWALSLDPTSIVSNSVFFSNSRGTCRTRRPILNGGFNISDDASCNFGTTTGANGQTIGDKIDALLDPNGLQDNGGPTQTIALQPNSPAIDAVPIALCPKVDQRGFKRPDPEDRGARRKGKVLACDIGAFESGATPRP